MHVVWGDWGKETVRLDFDVLPLGEVKLWAFRVCQWFDLGGFIILRSSLKQYVVKDKEGRVVYRYLKGNYHVVFDRQVKWTSNVRVMNWVALESGDEDLQRYVRMQCIKQTSTVRVSREWDKPIPKVVFRHGSQGRQIRNYLETRKFILEGLKRLEASEKRRT